MTVQSAENKNNYIGDGSRVSFPYGTYRVDSASHLQVFQDDVQQSSGYTVTGVGNENGGNVIFDTAPVNNTRVTLKREVPLTQLADYEAFDRFPSESHERALDLGTMADQQLREESTRQLTLPPSDTGSVELPARIASRYLGLDANFDFQWLEGTAVLPAEGDNIPVTATGTTRPIILADRHADVFQPKEFGDGTLTSTNINLAIAAAKQSSAPTKIVDLGVGVYTATSQVLVDDDNIWILGYGSGGSYNGESNIRGSAATRIVASGMTINDTLVKFTSDPSDTGTQRRRSGGGIIGVQLDGIEECGEGLHVESWYGGTFDVMTIYFTRRHVRLVPLQNGTSAESPSDIQHCCFRLHCRDVNSSNQPEAMLVINSASGANVSLNLFEDLRLRAETTSRAMDLGGSDGNVFALLIAGTRGTASGDGGKVFIHASDTITGTGIFQVSHARWNKFNYVQCTDGIVAKATPGGGTSSTSNIFDMVSRDNGAEAPTIENGADIQWIEGNCYYPIRVRIQNYQSASTSRLELYRNQDGQVPGNGLIGRVDWMGLNGSGTEKSWARIQARGTDVDAGQEDCELQFETIINDTLAARMLLKEGLMLGSITNLPTGNLGAEVAVCVGEASAVPSSNSGVAKIYVDPGDGDLKVKFGNNTVKTIATNP